LSQRFVLGACGQIRMSGSGPSRHFAGA